MSNLCGRLNILSCIHMFFCDYSETFFFFQIWYLSKLKKPAVCAKNTFPKLELNYIKRGGADGNGELLSWN